VKIALSNIVENPHRDLIRNPINKDQVDKIAESIARTGFWDNVVVRKSPTERGKYELAYGHNRMAALGHPTIKAVGDKRKLAQDSAQFIVRDLSDFDMLTAMADENATQQKITPKIVFENVTAAIVLAEKLLTECANVTEFNSRAKNTHRGSIHGVAKLHAWRANEFVKAKECLADGRGLGKDFMKHFLPDSARVEDHTLQAALDSHYAESRKAHAEAEAKRLAAEEARLGLFAEDVSQNALLLAPPSASSKGRRSPSKGPRSKGSARNWNTRALTVTYWSSCQRKATCARSSR